MEKSPGEQEMSSPCCPYVPLTDILALEIRPHLFVHSLCWRTYISSRVFFVSLHFLSWFHPIQLIPTIQMGSRKTLKASPWLFLKATKRWNNQQKVQYQVALSFFQMGYHKMHTLIYRNFKHKRKHAFQGSTCLLHNEGLTDCNLLFPWPSNREGYHQAFE